jgi:hypothetical protein
MAMQMAPLEQIRGITMRINKKAIEEVGVVYRGHAESTSLDNDWWKSLSNRNDNDWLLTTSWQSKAKYGGKI